MTIILDALKMKTRSEAHPYLQEMLGFPEYYGKNLDALFDCLTEMSGAAVYIENREEAGDFTKKILRVFSDAARENPDLVLLSEKPEEEEKISVSSDVENPPENNEVKSFSENPEELDDEPV